MKKFIAYYRVSTDKQKRSGLGLEAQQTAVRVFAEAHQGRIVKTYEEAETATGKRDRPELLKALAHARREGAVLVVAKLDRLTRNAGFMCALCDSGAKFVACDNPGINEMTAKILAVVAEEEAKWISSRTRAALTALKERGVLLGTARPGSKKLTPEARLKGAKKAGAILKSMADEAYTDLYPVVRQLRQEGKTLEAIASALNGEGYTTSRGLPWGKVQVGRLLGRADRLV